MLHITSEDITQLSFRMCWKMATLQARLLTQEDYERLKGRVKTLEGETRFKPGDYLARGVKGEN
jgi:hypothetical protein